MSKNKVSATNLARYSKQQNKISDLGWSLNPLIHWMQILGIYLPQDSTKNLLLSSFLRFIHKYGLHLVNIGSHVSLMVLSMWPLNSSQGIPNQQRKKDITLDWNLLIDNVTFAIYSIGIHSSIFLFLITKWKMINQSLLATFENTTELYNKDVCSSLKFRKLSFAGIFYILFSVLLTFLFFIIQISYSFKTFSYGLQEGVLIMIVGFKILKPGVSLVGILMWLSTWTKIYPTTALICFCVISNIIVDQLRAIQGQIEQLATASTADIICHLRQLQKQHILINRSIELINRTFGPILFIAIPFFFVGVINTISYSLLSFRTESWYLWTYTLITLASHLSNFVLVCLSADRIFSQVRDSLRQIIKKTTAI